MSSHKDNKVIGLKNAVKTTKITRKDLEIKHNVKYKYSHIYVPINEVDNITSYTVADEFNNGLLFIQNFKECYVMKTDNEPYYDCPVEAWKKCLSLLRVKYEMLEIKFQKRSLLDIANDLINNKNKDYTAKTFDERTKMIKKSLAILNNKQEVDKYFKKEMEKFEQDQVLNQEFNIVDSEIGVGDSIYVLHFSDLLQRRLTKSPFSMEEYVITNKNVRVNFYYGRHKEILDDYTTTFDAKPKSRKENVAYYDLSLYFDKEHDDSKELTMYVSSYYLEVFTSKEAALKYVRQFFPI